MFAEYLRRRADKEGTVVPDDGGPDTTGKDAASAGNRETAPTSSQRIAQGAEVLRRGIIPSYLATLLPTELMGPEACAEYLDQLARESAAADDPLARMAIEQLAVAHLRIVALHLAASEAKSAQATAAYSAAAVQLMAEHRRVSEALHARRQAALQPAKRPRFGTVS